jgi:hypothetical protein
MSQRAVHARLVAAALHDLWLAMCVAREQRCSGLHAARGEVPAARRKVESTLVLYGAAVANGSISIAEASVIHASVCEEHDHGEDELRAWASSLRRRAARWEAMEEEKNDELQVS